MEISLVSVPSLATASALALMIGLAASTAQAAVLAVDLTTNNSGTISDGTNTATFVFDKQQTSGTGVLDPFLCVQKTERSRGITQPRPTKAPIRSRKNSGPGPMMFSLGKH